MIDWFLRTSFSAPLTKVFSKLCGVGATFEEHIYDIAENDLIGDVKDKDTWISNRLKRPSES